MQSTKEEISQRKKTAASGYWFAFIIVVVAWLFAYFIIDPVRNVTNLVFNLMLVDPNVLIAFLGMFLVFIGWSFLEFLSEKTVHLSRYHDDQMFMLKRGIRIVVILYPIIVITCRYATIWTFSEWPLYIFGLALFAPFFILILKTKWFVTPASIDSQIEFDLKNKKIYIPIQIVLIVAFTIGPLLILIIAAFTEDVPWIKDFVFNVLVQFISNPIFITSGILLILFTVLYPVTEWLAWKFAKLAKLITTHDTKTAMKKVRKYTIVFVIVLTLSKLLPLTILQFQVISQGSLLYTAISAGLTVLISIIQTLIILARSKITQKKKQTQGA